jgi:ketosteroid isomerase-like protein
MTATTAGDTRHLIQRFLDAHARGDAEAISKLLSEDVQWQLPPVRRRRPVSRGRGGEPRSRRDGGRELARCLYHQQNGA